jgi:4-hydroxy-3-polyprenylbenzoate decarboxylase
MSPTRLIVAMTGASAATYGVRLLQVTRELDIETHGIITRAAAANIRIETPFTEDDVRKFCTQTYDERDVAANPASGSFITAGMVIIPCSMRTLAGVANGSSDNLVLRAADVCLKERRKLVLVPRETPLNLIHLKNMVSATEAGAVILPAMPAFYHRPRNIQDLIDHVVGKALDILEIQHSLYRRWSGEQAGGQVIT